VRGRGTGGVVSVSATGRKVLKYVLCFFVDIFMMFTTVKIYEKLQDKVTVFVVLVEPFCT